MSDTGQGPGWWQASDGKWYPPQAFPSPSDPTIRPTKGPSGCAVAAIVVAVAFGVMFVVALLSILAITFLGRSSVDRLSKLEGATESGAPRVEHGIDETAMQTGGSPSPPIPTRRQVTVPIRTGT